MLASQRFCGPPLKRATLLTGAIIWFSSCQIRLPEEPLPQPELSRSDRIYSITGFMQPESVRFDAEQDVWFVGNFNGDPDVADANGFVSRVSASTGEIEVLRFATGTEAHPFHAARGLWLSGDTLRAVDIGGVHSFDKVTGRHLGFLDLTRFQPGFLNDLSGDDGGTLYVTDTGKSSVYQIDGEVVGLAVSDSALGGPNGVSFAPSLDGFLLMPWFPGHPVHLWSPDRGARPFVEMGLSGRIDGVEGIDGRWILASQADSALHVFWETGSRRLISLGGAPADIGLDIRGRRVAVPFPGENRVDVWQLPTTICPEPYFEGETVTCGPST